MPSKRVTKPDVDMVSTDASRQAAELHHIDKDAAEAALALPPQIMDALARCLPSAKLQAIALLSAVCLHDTKTLARRFHVSERTISRIRTTCLRTLRRNQEVLWKKE